MTRGAIVSEQSIAAPRSHPKSSFRLRPTTCMTSGRTVQHAERAVLMAAPSWLATIMSTHGSLRSCFLHKADLVVLRCGPT